jgi:two-component system sensor histidine kinase/response regulator
LSIPRSLLKPSHQKVIFHTMETQLLLIEDETPIRENIAELLTLNGFAVKTASNGKEGILLAMQHHPDLILCDVMMPEMDGFQTLEVIRANPSLSSVPFLFLTAKADVTDTRKGMALGADDYLTKPFKIDTLLTAIQARLHRETQRKANTQALLKEQIRSMTNLSTHEYNTPISGILGFTTLLISYYGDFSQTETLSMLDMIKVNCLRLKRSLDNNRLMTRLQEMSPRDSAYNFFTTGTSVLNADVIDKELLSAAYRQSLHVPCEIDVESVLLRISEENLSTIIGELVDNAIKFSTHDQSIRIIGRKKETSYEFVIINHGQVFNPDDIKRMAPYMQFDRAKYEQQGFGLGLAITKKLVELNNGSLNIESIATGTTQVTLQLPIS